MDFLNNDNLILYDKLCIGLIIFGLIILVISFIKSVRYKKTHFYNHTLDRKTFKKAIINRYIFVYLGFFMMIIGSFAKLYINHLITGLPLLSPTDDKIITKIKDILNKNIMQLSI